MIELQVKDDIAKLQKKYAHLGNVVTKAANRSLNRTATAVQTLAVREISKATNIKPARKVKEVFSIVKSNFSTLTAIVKARRKPLNMIEFVALSKRRVGAFDKQAGVVTKAWGRTLVRRGTFIARGKNSGKLLVVRIRSGGAGPRGGTGVKAVPGPSIPMSFLRKEIQKAVVAHGRKVFIKNMTHELNRAIERLK